MAVTITGRGLSLYPYYNGQVLSDELIEIYEDENIKNFQKVSFLKIKLRRPVPISCRKWDVSYFSTLKKKITNFYVACAAIYSNNTLTNEFWD